MSDNQKEHVKTTCNHRDIIFLEKPLCFNCVLESIDKLEEVIAQLQKENFYQNTEISRILDSLPMHPKESSTRLDDHDTDIMYIKKRIEKLEDELYQLNTWIKINFELLIGAAPIDIHKDYHQRLLTIEDKLGISEKGEQNTRKFEDYKDMLVNELNNEIKNARSKWINVKTKLPAIDEEVLVYSYEDEITNGMYVARIHGFKINGRPSWLYAWCCDGCVPNVTHWMPLPEYPKDE